VPGYGDQFEEIAATLRKSAAAMRDAGIGYALGGSLAAWARGGPESCKDLDFMVREQDAERALEALEAVGMRRERPPEDWLVKAWDGEVLVDLIHHAAGVPVDNALLERADQMSVLSITMRVLRLEDVITSKLLALTEHQLDYGPLLTIVRTVREQLDWEEVRARTSRSPYARAFFSLLRELDLGIDTASSDVAHARGSRIRVLPPS
jgi:predicted nucleotidyltransferase